MVKGIEIFREHFADYSEDPVDPKSLKLSGFTNADILERLKMCYRL
jgi:hypothetical protein